MALCFLASLRVSCAMQRYAHPAGASLKTKGDHSNESSLSDQLGAVNASGQEASAAVTDFNETAYETFLQFNETVGLVDELLGKVQKVIGSLEITQASPKTVEDATTYLIVANETLDKMNKTVAAAFWNFSGSMGQLADEIALDVSLTVGEVAKAATVNVTNMTEELKQAKQLPDTTDACEKAQDQIDAAKEKAPEIVAQMQDLNEKAPTMLLDIINATNITLTQVNDTLAQIVAVPGFPNSTLATLQAVQESVMAVKLAFAAQADVATATLIPLLANATTVVEQLPELVDMAVEKVQAACALVADNQNASIPR